MNTAPISMLAYKMNKLVAGITDDQQPEEALKKLLKGERDLRAQMQWTQELPRLKVGMRLLQPL